MFFRKEESRRIALNAIGPVWDGNEVWLVIAGGTLFAGFPVVYATVFSAFYVPFMLFLVALIFRAISIEFRGKEPMSWWRKTWDWSYCISSTLITLLLGLVLGNLVQGLPIDKDFEFRGSFIEFLNPYAFLVSVTTLSLFMMHGAIYLVLKTENRIYTRLTIIVKDTTRFFVGCFLTTTVVTLLHVPHMVQTFLDYPFLFGIPLVTVLLVINITRQVKRRKYFPAFLSSGTVAALLLMSFAIGLYPNIVLSTLDSANNITIYNAASSAKSLKIMLTIAAIGVPIVATYTSFVFWVFRGKVRLDEMSY